MHVHAKKLKCTIYMSYMIVLILQLSAIFFFGTSSNPCPHSCKECNELGRHARTYQHYKVKLSVYI